MTFKSNLISLPSAQYATKCCYPVVLWRDTWGGFTRSRRSRRQLDFESEERLVFREGRSIVNAAFILIKVGKGTKVYFITALTLFPFVQSWDLFWSASAPVFGTAWVLGLHIHSHSLPNCKDVQILVPKKSLFSRHLRPFLEESIFLQNESSSKSQEELQKKMTWRVT